jgi:hypothetical protein
MIDPFGEKRGHFQYSDILAKLTEINESLIRRIDEEDKRNGEGETDSNLKEG